MKFHYLEAFVSIVEWGTVTEASQRLHIAQPALSRYIHNLEKELGHTLFDHQNGRLHVTPFGQRVYPMARHILDEVQLFNHGKIDQRLSIGASLTTLTTFLPKAIRIFRETFSTTDIHVETGMSSDIYDLVGSGRVEIGIVSDAKNRAYFRVIPLFTDPLWVLCPLENDWQVGSSISIKQLGNCPLILMTTRTMLRNDLEALFRSHEVIPNIRMEVDNVDIIQRMVSAGLGITILPRSVCLDAAQHVDWRAIPLEDTLPSTPDSQLNRTFGIITLNAEISQIARSWIDLCLNLAKHF